MACWVEVGGCGLNYFEALRGQGEVPLPPPKNLDRSACLRISNVAARFWIEPELCELIGWNRSRAETKQTWKLGEPFDLPEPNRSNHPTRPNKMGRSARTTRAEPSEFDESPEATNVQAHVFGFGLRRPKKKHNYRNAWQITLWTFSPDWNIGWRSHNKSSKRGDKQHPQENHPREVVWRQHETAKNNTQF